MRATTKILLIFLAVMGIVPVLSWAGTLLYWHITIQREIREIENEPPKLFSSAVVVMVSGGCRSLPYLVDVLESSPSQAALDSAMLGIAAEVGATGTATAIE